MFLRVRGESESDRDDEFLTRIEKRIRDETWVITIGRATDIRTMGMGGRNNTAVIELYIHGYR